MGGTTVAPFCEEKQEGQSLVRFLACRWKKKDVLCEMESWGVIILIIHLITQ